MHSEARTDTAMTPVPLTAERRIELEFYVDGEFCIDAVRSRLMSLINNRNESNA